MRPELSGPMISEMAPRGKPSITASSEARPVGRDSRILASGRNPSVVMRAAFGFMQFRLFFAYHIVGAEAPLSRRCVARGWRLGVGCQALTLKILAVENPQTWTHCSEEIGVERVTIPRHLSSEHGPVYVTIMNDRSSRIPRSQRCQSIRGLVRSIGFEGGSQNGNRGCQTRQR